MKIKIKAVFDRVEGSRAVLVLEEGDSIELPVSLLPKDASEGDIISLTLQKKDKKTLSEKEKVKGLIEKLAGK